MKEMRKENLKPKLEECRYGEILSGLLSEYANIYAYHGEADYQGSVAIAWSETKRYGSSEVYFFYEYSYGSCSGCDEWEDRGLTHMEIASEMIRDTSKFEKEEELIEFLKKGHNELELFFEEKKEEK